MKLLSLLIILFTPALGAAETVFCDVNWGLQLINQPDYAPAQIEMILNGCDKKSPNAVSVQLLHGLFERTNNHLNQAIEWLEKARQSDPKNTGICLELATTYVWNKQLDKAEQLYYLILKTDPLNREAQLGLARIELIQAHYGQAMAIYDALLKINPFDVDALKGLGWTYTAQNNLTKAEFYFSQVLSIQPQNTDALTALSTIKHRLALLACDINKGLQLLDDPASLPQLKAIEAQCRLHQIENKEIVLFYGLVARKEAEKSKNYSQAIAWFIKAATLPPQNDERSALELALTYEWANERQKALLIYQNTLKQNPLSRSAWLGKARIARFFKNWSAAQVIYVQLIKEDPLDVDALNGLGWIALSQNQFNLAVAYFTQSLHAQLANVEAVAGLRDIKEIKEQRLAALRKKRLCDIEQGLILVNQKNPPLSQIEFILNRCDKNAPNTTTTLMLHGLLARYLGQQDQDYSQAIYWFNRAVASASKTDQTPKLELAVTYEWAGDYPQALAIYDQLISQDANNRVALLGKARTLRFSYHIKSSLALYYSMLHHAPHDLEVLSGLAETYRVDYNFDQARVNINKILALDPNNVAAQDELSLLNASTKNLLEVTLGHYAVPPNTSDGLNLYYFNNINATDGLSVLATHNTKQIESGFGTGSALLPNNSLLVGYQRSIPNKYGWQLSYDGRQHNSLPFENRIYGTANLYLQRSLEWFGGLRLAFPDQWNTQLLISGLTAHTSLPVNITVTGFWAFQQIGGYNSSYSLDLSKEFGTHFYYNFGPSYLVEQQSWELHGKLIIPFFEKQAMVIQGSHYLFNRSTFVTAGWRVYWA